MIVRGLAGDYDQWREGDQSGAQPRTIQIVAGELILAAVTSLPNVVGGRRPCVARTWCLDPQRAATKKSLQPPSQTKDRAGREQPHDDGLCRPDCAAVALAYRGRGLGRRSGAVIIGGYIVAVVLLDHAARCAAIADRLRTADQFNFRNNFLGRLTRAIATERSVGPHGSRVVHCRRRRWRPRRAGMSSRRRRTRPARNDGVRGGADRLVARRDDGGARRKWLWSADDRAHVVHDGALAPRKWSLAPGRARRHKKRQGDEWKTPQAHAETRIGHFYSSVNRPTPSLGEGSRAGAVTKTSQSSKLRELGYSGVKARN